MRRREGVSSLPQGEHEAFHDSHVVRVKRRQGVSSLPHEHSAHGTSSAPSHWPPVVITASVGFDLGTTDELVVIDPQPRQEQTLVDPIVSSFIDPENVQVGVGCRISTRDCQIATRMS